eukprot:jgi/Chrpa1/11539/Chrysochromulina_OHIO_Genome00019774-RA
MPGPPAPKSLPKPPPDRRLSSPRRSAPTPEPPPLPPPGPPPGPPMRRSALAWGSSSQRGGEASEGAAQVDAVAVELPNMDHAGSGPAPVAEGSPSDQARGFAVSDERLPNMDEAGGFAASDERRRLLSAASAVAQEEPDSSREPSPRRGGFAAGGERRRLIAPKATLGPRRVSSGRSVTSQIIQQQSSRPRLVGSFNKSGSFGKSGASGDSGSEGSTTPKSMSFTKSDLS